MLVFVGTQANAIFAARLEATNGGRLTLLGEVAAIPRPTCVLVDPAGRTLYAASEVGNAGDRIGDVFSFAIEDVSGTLRLLSQQPSGGGGPTDLALGPDSETLFVANFGGGQVAALPVAPDGTLGAANSVLTNTGSGPHRRQQGPHAHGVTLDPSRGYVLVPDMGADRVFTYAYDAKNRTLTPAETPFIATAAGAGPRLIRFSANGRYAFLLTELSAEIYSFRWSPSAGRLEFVAAVPLDAPKSETSRSAAAIALSADGRFLYASNRTTNTMEVFAVDGDAGAVGHIQSISAGGEKPWCAEISPGGGFLAVANQASDAVQLFSINPSVGMLRAVGSPVAVPMPTGISFA